MAPSELLLEVDRRGLKRRPAPRRPEPLRKILRQSDTALLNENRDVKACDRQGMQRLMQDAALPINRDTDVNEDRIRACLAAQTRVAEDGGALPRAEKTYKEMLESMPGAFRGSTDRL